ncbi:cardiolipin synthase ClsB [Ideonella sp. B508-1]|uniref:cardiolipin synthase ClsB n=1 Tax=Ideonella sp. B508-1 TaxID=137716 RepID=UPI00034D7617|nr:cardiolipin synthase ClsB [Ideonella sp. B508-1]
MPPTDASAADTPVHPGSWYIFSRPVFFGHNEVRLLRGGDELFPRLIEAIGQALHEVWLATYIFYDDSAAEAVALALAAAARRGVRVRVVVDGFGSHRSLPTLQRWLEPAGVHFTVFRPLERWWNWLQPGQMRRLHQKLCVVDGQRAFVGGINLIDDRNDIHHGRSEHPRLDFAAEVHGPAAMPVEQTVRAIWTRAAFGEDWRQEVLNLVRSARPVRSARQYLRQLRILPPHPALPPGDGAPVQVAFVVRDNMRQRRAIERSLIEAIRLAERRVDLVTPYFYPGHSFRRALIKAARRGVRVRLLLQGKLDYRIAGLAARVLYDELLVEGIEIYEYMPAFLHAKMAMADEDWITVGSSNVDPLSLLLNLEANLVVRDETLTAAASREFELALTQSLHITVAPLRRGWAAMLGRGLVAWMAHWYLRLAGWNERY